MGAAPPGVILIGLRDGRPELRAWNLDRGRAIIDRLLWETLPGTFGRRLVLGRPFHLLRYDCFSDNCIAMADDSAWSLVWGPVYAWRYRPWQTRPIWWAVQYLRRDRRAADALDGHVPTWRLVWRVWRETR